jgi:ABC-type branched-subunit amino acid transport system permease subunit
LDNAIIVALLVGCVYVGRRVDNQNYVDGYHANVILRIAIAVILAVSLQLINGISGQFSLGHAGFMAVGAYLGGYATVAYTKVTTADEDILYFQRPAAAAGFFVCLLICALVAAAVLVGLFLLIRQSRKLHSSLPALLLLAVAGWFIYDISQAAHLTHLPWRLIWSKGFLGLQQLFGTLIDWSQKFAPSIDDRLPHRLLAPLSFAVSLLGGGVFAGLVGLVVGLPTLRLRGDYLAIATLGFAAIISVVIFNTEALGGATGLQVPTYLRTDDDNNPLRYIAPWIFGAMILTIVVVWRLARSPKGRAIIAVREDEIAAAAMGIDVTHHKVLAFVVGAFFAGVAGSLFAHHGGFVTTGSFELLKSVELVIIVTIGGLGSIPGAIIAAIVLTWLPEFLRDPASWTALFARPFGIQSEADLHLPVKLITLLGEVSQFRLTLYAILLIAIMLARSLRTMKPLIHALLLGLALIAQKQHSYFWLAIAIVAMIVVEVVARCWRAIANAREADTLPIDPTDPPGPSGSAIASVAPSAPGGAA